MFSSLRLNSLKCQSNSGDEGKQDHEKNEDGENDDYEKSPIYGKESAECKVKTSPEVLVEGVSKWRMDCPTAANFAAFETQGFRNDHEERFRNVIGNEQAKQTKVTTVNIRREDGTLGITLRGGFRESTESARPVIITEVKPDGPAAREGTVKAGDRLLAVDGVALKGKTLVEAQALLKQPTAFTQLTIEYDVSVLESVENANGPLLVEIERRGNQELGLTLSQNNKGVFIERVKPGSLADRCGALHVGDEILAVNMSRVDRASVSLEDVTNLLGSERAAVRLEILPSNAASCYLNYGSWRTKEPIRPLEGSFSLNGTLKERRCQECKRTEMEHLTDYRGNRVNPHGLSGAEFALTHCDSLHVTLEKDNGNFGIEFMDAADGSVLICSVTPGGPAERSQCLHPGDRLLAINHRNTTLYNLSAKDVNDLVLSSACEKLSLHTEFDVLETVVPASGVFTVKLVKRWSGGLGITMMASSSSGFIICEMKKGSIAHRSGSLLPGDRILAINNFLLDQCSVEYAAHILHQSTNIVALTVQREDSNSVGGTNRRVTYTVDLQKYGGPLGITITGSEELFHPITISSLTPGGLAEQTGVIHVGDEILAINDHSLYGEPLSKAHSLLKSSSDLVTLKISRFITPIFRTPNSRSPVLPSSVDSAVESWDSSHLDLNSAVNLQKPVREAKESLDRVLDLSGQDDNFVESIDGNISTHQSALDEITCKSFKTKQEKDILSVKSDEEQKSKIEGNENDKWCGVNGLPVHGINVAEGSSLSDAEHVFESLEEARRIEDFDNRERQSYMIADSEQFEIAYIPTTKNWGKNQYFIGDSQGSLASEFHSSNLYEVTLRKDPIYEDFGFSVSDGLYERGVFINRIRKGGPADLSNILKPFDRILQVNDTFTQDFDCCLTVPLIASAGDTLVLLVSRNHENFTSENKVFEGEKLCNKGIKHSTIKPESGDHQEIKILV